MLQAATTFKRSEENLDLPTPAFAGDEEVQVLGRFDRQRRHERPLDRHLQIDDPILTGPGPRAGVAPHYRQATADGHPAGRPHRVLQDDRSPIGNLPDAVTRRDATGPDTTGLDATGVVVSSGPQRDGPVRVGRSIDGGKQFVDVQLTVAHRDAAGLRALVGYLARTKNPFSSGVAFFLFAGGCPPIAQLD